MEMANHKNMNMVKGHNKPYNKLIIMIIISFIAMYILMYAMVDSFANAVPNINQFYMAGLMTTAMVIIEVLLMGDMYMNKKLNAIIIALSSVVLVAFFFFIQQQTAVSDKQFLKSMIPHHASAILMSEKSTTQDPEIKKLQSDIISSQRKEIEQMKAKLKELNK